MCCTILVCHVLIPSILVCHAGQHWGDFVRAVFTAWMCAHLLVSVIDCVCAYTRVKIASMAVFSHGFCSNARGTTVHPVARLHDTMVPVPSAGTRTCSTVRPKTTGQPPPPPHTHTHTRTPHTCQHHHHHSYTMCQHALHRNCVALPRVLTTCSCGDSRPGINKGYQSPSLQGF